MGRKEMTFSWHQKKMNESGRLLSLKVLSEQTRVWENEKIKNFLFLHRSISLWYFYIQKKNQVWIIMSDRCLSTSNWYWLLWAVCETLAYLLLTKVRNAIVDCFSQEPINCCPFFREFKAGFIPLGTNCFFYSHSS